MPVFPGAPNRERMERWTKINQDGTFQLRFAIVRCAWLARIGGSWIAAGGDCFDSATGSSPQANAYLAQAELDRPCRKWSLSWRTMLHVMGLSRCAGFGVLPHPAVMSTQPARLIRKSVRNAARQMKSSRRESARCSMTTSASTGCARSRWGSLWIESADDQICFHELDRGFLYGNLNSISCDKTK